MLELAIVALAVSLLTLSRLSLSLFLSRFYLFLSLSLSAPLSIYLLIWLLRLQCHCTAICLHKSERKCKWMWHHKHSDNVLVVNNHKNDLMSIISAYFIGDHKRHISTRRVVQLKTWKELFPFAPQHFPHKNPIINKFLRPNFHSAPATAALRTSAHGKTINRTAIHQTRKKWKQTTIMKWTFRREKKNKLGSNFFPVAFIIHERMKCKGMGSGQKCLFRFPFWDCFNHSHGTKIKYSWI